MQLIMMDDPGRQDSKQPSRPHLVRFIATEDCLSGHRRSIMPMVDPMLLSGWYWMHPDPAWTPVDLDLPDQLLSINPVEFF